MIAASRVVKAGFYHSVLGSTLYWYFEDATDGVGHGNVLPEDVGLRPARKNTRYRITLEELDSPDEEPVVNPYRRQRRAP